MNFKETITHVFSLSYIFDFSFMPFSSGDRLYMIAGLVSVIFAAIFEIFSLWSKNPVTKNMWHKLAAPLGTGGILEVIWYGLRFENVKLFGSHFAAWLIGLITLIWFVTALVYALRQYRAEKDKWEKQQVKLKYLKH